MAGLVALGTGLAFITFNTSDVKESESVGSPDSKDNETEEASRAEPHSERKIKYLENIKLLKQTYKRKMAKNEFLDKNDILLIEDCVRMLASSEIINIIQENRQTRRIYLENKQYQKYADVVEKQVKSVFIILETHRVEVLGKMNCPLIVYSSSLKALRRNDDSMKNKKISALTIARIKEEMQLRAYAELKPDSIILKTQKDKNPEKSSEMTKSGIQTVQSEPQMTHSLICNKTVGFGLQKTDQNPLEALSLDLYVEIKKYQLEQYKALKIEIANKRLYTSVKKTIVWDLVFKKYGFEDEHLAYQARVKGFDKVEAVLALEDRFFEEMVKDEREIKKVAEEKEIEQNQG